MDGDSTTNRYRAGSNDEIYAKEESVKSSDGGIAANSVNISDAGSAANQRGTSRSDKFLRKRRLLFFEWKIDSLEEYWKYIINACTWPDDDNKGQGIYVIVDNGG